MLTVAMKESNVWCWFRSRCPRLTKDDLREMLAATEKRIMSKITDQMDAEQRDADAISLKLDSITAGIAELDRLITEFQNSPGTLSAADQTAVDKIQSVISGLRSKAEGISTTPPTPPTP